MTVQPVTDIEDEQKAIANLIRNAGIPGLKSVLDEDPTQLPSLPCVTVEWDGFLEPEAASTRSAREYRIYDVRLYIDSMDYRGARKQLRSLLPQVWRVLVKSLQLSDSTHVIQVWVMETNITLLQDGTKRLLEAKIRVRSEHRTPLQ